MLLADFSRKSADPAMCERGCWVDELLAAAFDGEVQRLRGTLNAKLAIVSARDKSARGALIFSYFCVRRCCLKVEQRPARDDATARREIRLGRRFPNVARIKNYNSRTSRMKTFSDRWIGRRVFCERWRFNYLLLSPSPSDSALLCK